jgi:tetratricopeptide (TPR) repeat protein
MTARILLVFGVAAALAWSPLVARAAQDGENPVREAGKHFQRGVALYSEADYAAALVEFQRAYTLSPNAAVLYNVGETEFQLRDYAGALATFERYLAEASGNDPHRSEVEANAKVLRSRVGRLSIATIPSGADVTIDDRSVGRTPIDRPLMVAVGHLKVTATASGRAPVTRYVDVAADDNVSVTLDLPAPAGESAPGPTERVSQEAAAPPHDGSTLRTVGWIAAGVLAAGAIGLEIVARTEAKDLDDARNTYPTTADTLNHHAHLTTIYSIAADSVAAAAIVVGGLTLYSTLVSSRGDAGATRVSVGLTSVRFEMTF